VKKIFTKIACIGQNSVLLGFVAAKASYLLQHANFLLKISQPTGISNCRPHLPHNRLNQTAYCILLGIIALITITPAGLADTDTNLANLLIKSLRAYEAHRPMEAEEWWRKASELEPRLARPPWLTPGQELPANIYAHSTENTGYSLWGLFIRLLTLPLLLALLTWQGWKAIQDLHSSMPSSKRKPVMPADICPECTRLRQECQKLQRKIEILQGTASGRGD
jgi:hypothetical protein